MTSPLTSLPTAQVMALHNAFSAKQVRKFQSRAVAEARTAAVLEEAGVSLRTALQRTFGLSGKRLDLFNLLCRKGGISEPEASEALGWVKCGATIFRVIQAAQGMGYVATYDKGEDGLTRYALHTVN